mmetsp:Transcript_105242/g.304442  ORF Transcript_105242/g.304442 Transcript_105242/m.304442 type:complete len:425 (-) Transcript_105242:179-1453(-)
MEEDVLVLQMCEEADDLVHQSHEADLLLTPTLQTLLQLKVAEHRQVCGAPGVFVENFLQSMIPRLLEGYIVVEAPCHQVLELVLKVKHARDVRVWIVNVLLVVDDRRAPTLDIGHHDLRYEGEHRRLALEQAVHQCKAIVLFLHEHPLATSIHLHQPLRGVEDELGLALFPQCLGRGLVKVPLDTGVLVIEALGDFAQHLLARILREPTCHLRLVVAGRAKKKRVLEVNLVALSHRRYPDEALAAQFPLLGDPGLIVAGRAEHLNEQPDDALVNVLAVPLPVNLVDERLHTIVLDLCVDMFLEHPKRGGEQIRVVGLVLGEEPVQVLEDPLHPEREDRVLLPEVCQHGQELLACAGRDLAGGLLAILTDDLFVVSIELRRLRLPVAKLYNDRVGLHKGQVRLVCENAGLQVLEQRLHPFHLDEL